jgi:hypothetical protein
MTDTFRALCARMADELDHYRQLLMDDRRATHALAAEARAALNQPAPAPPTVMEIIELHSWLEDEWRANNDGEDLPMLDFARAVLARWGTPANNTRGTH